MVTSLKRWLGKVAVVTGCSCGIGASVTKMLIKAGVHVVGLDKREERFDELKCQLKNEPGQLYPLKTDLTKEDDILNAFEWIKNNVGPVHILVNCAGMRRNTNLIEGRTEFWKQAIDTNVLGLCIATREAVQAMKKSNVDGHIIHINSVGGHKSIYVPDVNVYNATKFAVTALTETLRQELNSIGSKIKVTSISPGRVDTEFRTNSQLLSVGDIPQLEPEDVADAILYVLGTSPHVQVHDLMIKPIGEAI